MRKLFLWVILSGIFTLCHAQLNKLCPISSTVYDTNKVKGMNLLLNTKDCTSFLTTINKTRRTSTVQLVNAAHPFPPLWYQMGNPAADTGGFFQSTFMLDIRIQESTGNLTYFYSNPSTFFGSTTFDTATLQQTDTLKRYLTSPVNDNFILDPHDYQTDAAGNKLISNHILKKIDVRCLSGLEKDSVRPAWINEILILNSKDSIIFRWNPLDHLSTCEMNWAYERASLLFGTTINWSHVNSVRFANDGNILYSFRHIGLGKINSKTGEIMWKLGGKDSLNSIRLTNSNSCYLQHDFLQRKDGLYSVFSNGDSTHPYSEALVYKINEIKKTATLVSRYRPKPKIFSVGMGNYDCKGDTCIVSFGAYKQTSPKKTAEMAHILINKKLVATISAPYPNYAYKVLQTKWAAIQRRPRIILKNNTLQSDSLNGLHDYKWYKIDSTTATPVGIGKIFSPNISGSYVVEAQQGTGVFKSFLLSDVFIFKKEE